MYKTKRERIIQSMQELVEGLKIPNEDGATDSDEPLFTGFTRGDVDGSFFTDTTSRIIGLYDTRETFANNDANKYVNVSLLIDLEIHVPKENHLSMSETLGGFLGVIEKGIRGNPTLTDSDNNRLAIDTRIIESDKDINGLTEGHGLGRLRCNVLYRRLRDDPTQ